MPGLPLGTAVSAPVGVVLGRVRDLLERNLIEQCVTQNLRQARHMPSPSPLAGRGAG